MQKIVPIRPKSAAELQNLIQKIGTKADIIEIWLDRHADELIDVIQKICAEKTNKINGPKFLAVCKTPEEKGIFLGSMEEKLAILQKFLDAGGDYVDVDFGRFPQPLTDQLPSEKLWLSWHNFFETPNDIHAIVQKMSKKNPFLIKLAVTCNTESELNHFIRFIKKIDTTRRANGESLQNTESKKFCFTTMGAFGSFGRKILREEKLTWGEFYALDENRKTAEGQPVLLSDKP